MNDMKPMRTSVKVCGKNGTDFLEVKDNNIADMEASRKGGEEEENSKRTKCFIKVSDQPLLSESHFSKFKSRGTKGLLLDECCLHVQYTISIRKIRKSDIGN